MYFAHLCFFILLGIKFNILFITKLKAVYLTTSQVIEFSETMSSSLTPINCDVTKHIQNKFVYVQFIYKPIFTWFVKSIIIYKKKKKR